MGYNKFILYENNAKGVLAMSNKNVEMMKALLEEKKKQNASGGSMRPDKKIGNSAKAKNNKRIGVNKV